MDPALLGTTGLGIHNARRMDRPTEPVAPPPPSSQVPIFDGGAGAGSVSGSGAEAGTGSSSDPSPGSGSSSGAGSTEPSYSQYATCGDDNGKIYLTEHGKFLGHTSNYLTSLGSTYKLQCSYSGAGRVPIGGISSQELTFAACKATLLTLIQCCTDSTRHREMF